MLTLGACISANTSSFSMFSSCVSAAILDITGSGNVIGGGGGGSRAGEEARLLSSGVSISSSDWLRELLRPLLGCS